MSRLGLRRSPTCRLIDTLRIGSDHFGRDLTGEACVGFCDPAPDSPVAHADVSQHRDDRLSFSTDIETVVVQPAAVTALTTHQPAHLLKASTSDHGTAS